MQKCVRLDPEPLPITIIIGSNRARAFGFAGVLAASVFCRQRKRSLWVSKLTSRRPTDSVSYWHRADQVPEQQKVN